MQREKNINIDRDRLEKTLLLFQEKLAESASTQEIMLHEAAMTKALYRLAADAVGYGDFTRSKRGGGVDVANRYLDHGNYLAYGLAAVATWVSGLPHGLSVLHGKTRRGGLVFDVADLIKDALILPQAFIAAMEGEDEQEFRQRCIRFFQRAEALDVMIVSLQAIAQRIGQEEK